MGLNMLIKITFLILLLPSLCFSKLEWQEVFYNHPDILVDIDCIDSVNCLMFSKRGSYGRVYKTTDAGISWEKIFDESPDTNPGKPLADPDWCESMEYAGLNHFYLGYIKEHIRSTSDGGKTYDTTIINTVKKFNRMPISEISMLDSLTGVCRYSKELYYTDDGWETYQLILEMYDLEYHQFYNLELLGNNEIAIFEKDNLGFDTDTAISYYSRTKDLGLTWEKSVIVYENLRVDNICHIGDSIIFIGGDILRGSGSSQTDKVYKSTDGGKTWREILSHFDQNFPFGVRDMEFLDENNGILACNYGKVLRTTDGGDSWFYNNFNDDPPNCAVAYAGDTALLCNFNGKVFRLVEDGTSVTTLNNTELLCYPNPFYESVTISFPEFMRGEAKIEIYNSVGLLIEQSNFTIGSGEMVFTPDADVPGVYFYRITHGTEIYQGNFVKME
jgi:hypothetical protein